MVSKAVEVRGLKVSVTEVPIPVAYGPAFEGERVRGDDIYLEAAAAGPLWWSYSVLKNMNEIEDGKIEVVGPDIPDIKPGTKLPFAIFVEFAGRKMQEDFLPILERQIHHLINYAQGLMHIGQRDISWIRLAKQAVEKGFTFKHIGSILHAMYHKDFGSIVDKVQITIHTEERQGEGNCLMKRAKPSTSATSASPVLPTKGEPLFTPARCASLLRLRMCAS